MAMRIGRVFVIVTPLMLVGSTTAGAACPVTIPNGSRPPGEQGSPRSHGNGKLWTPLPLDGKLVIPPVRPPDSNVGILSNGSIRWKYPWWGSRAAGRWLTIRVSERGRVVRSQRIGPGSRARSPRFWASYVIFPSVGCWRVTAHAGRATLTFVISVSTGPS